MAMTACKECGKAVSTGAKTCPHCGTSAPAKKKGKGGIGKWLLIVFAIGLVAMILPKQDKATTFNVSILNFILIMGADTLAVFLAVILEKI